MKKKTKNFINLFIDLTLAVMIFCNLFNYCLDGIKQLLSGDFTEHAFSYFTTLSNLFAMTVSAIEAVAIFIILLKHKEEVPKWIQYVKAMSSFLLGLAMILVLSAFFARGCVDVPKYFYGKELISHIIAPVISLVQFILFGGKVTWWKVLIPAEIFGGTYSFYYVYNTYITDTWKKDPYDLWKYGFWIGMLMIGVCAISIFLLTFFGCFFHNKVFKKQEEKISNNPF